MMLKSMRLTVSLMALSAALNGAAEARNRVIDGGNVSACNVATTFGSIPTDSFVEIPIGIYSSACAATPTTPFSINVGGTSFSSIFVNENGVISLGGPINDAPSTPLADLTTIAFAPFFADGFLPDNDALKYGWTDPSVGFANSLWITWDNFLPQGNTTATPNIMQLGIAQVGASGDFDLILNYEILNWDSATIGAQAGVTNGAATDVVLNGATTPGAYLGTFDETTEVCSGNPATALACNKINDGSQPIGNPDPSNPSNGYYLFKFRGGVLVGGGGDADGDGVGDADDQCPATAIPERAPTTGVLGRRRYALTVAGKTTFSAGPGARLSFTVADTAGCSCTQIAERLFLSASHLRSGCSAEAMRTWINGLP